ncbi:MAG TPA: DMT family transporter [Haliangiales bacterium]|nr:DMT family transporter [Haliangiales bacterium]
MAVALPRPRSVDRVGRGAGIAELLASALLFAIMALLSKRATRTMHAAQVVFVRFAIGALVVLAQARLRGVRLAVVRRDLLLLRGFFGGMAVLAFFVGIERLPVGTATLFNYTSPVFTATFSAIFLHERLRLGSVGAMGVALLGVILVVVGQGQALGGAYVWQALALSSAVLSGAAVTAIRAARRTDGAWEVFGAFCVVGMACALPFMIGAWHAPTAGEWALLLAVGLTAAAGQILMTHAALAVTAATAGVIQQVTVVAALALGYVVEGDPVSVLSLFGAVLTVAGVSVAATR